MKDGLKYRAFAHFAYRKVHFPPHISGFFCLFINRESLAAFLDFPGEVWRIFHLYIVGELRQCVVWQIRPGCMMSGVAGLSFALKLCAQISRWK